MMTIDEAIKQYEKAAENEEKLSIEGKWFEGEDWNVKARAQCAECATDYRQLAAWLRELKELREQMCMARRKIPEREISGGVR